MTTTTIYVERNGEELEVEVSAHVSPIVRGRYHGPWEDCYPDEGGEVGTVTATFEGKPFELTDAELSDAEDRLGEVAAEDYRTGAYDDGPEPDDYPDDVCDQFYSPY